MLKIKKMVKIENLELKSFAKLFFTEHNFFFLKLQYFYLVSFAKNQNVCRKLEYS